MFIPQRIDCKSGTCAACLSPDCVICGKEPARYRDPETHRGYCAEDWRSYQTSLASIRDQLCSVSIRTPEEAE